MLHHLVLVTQVELCCYGQKVMYYHLQRYLLRYNGANYTFHVIFVLKEPNIEPLGSRTSIEIVEIEVNARILSLWASAPRVHVLILAVMKSCISVGSKPLHNVSRTYSV